MSQIHKTINEFSNSKHFFSCPNSFPQLFCYLHNKEEKKEKNTGEKEGEREAVGSGQEAQHCGRGFPCMGKALGLSPALQNSNNPTWPPIMLPFPPKGNGLLWREQGSY